MVYVYHIHITEVIRTWPDIQPVYFTYWGISPFGMTSFSEAFLRGLREAERVQSLEGDEPVWSLMKDGFFWGVVGVVSYPSVGKCLKIRTYQRPKETVEWDGNLRIWKFKDMYFYISAIYSYNDQYIWKPASISLATLYPSRPYILTISNFSNVNVSWHYFPFSYTWLLNYIILNYRFDMVWFDYSSKTISFSFSTWKKWVQYMDVQCLICSEIFAVKLSEVSTSRVHVVMKLHRTGTWLRANTVLLKWMAISYWITNKSVDCWSNGGTWSLP